MAIRNIYGYVYGSVGWFFFAYGQYCLILRRDWRWWERIGGFLISYGFAIAFVIHSARLLFGV